MKRVIVSVICLVIGCLLGFFVGSKYQGNAVKSAIKEELVVAPIQEEPTKPEEPTYKAKVAIILDDWGYNLNAFDELIFIDAPLNLAVLPNLPYSQKIAEDAFAMGHEILLHMPMQPKSNIPLEKSTLLTSMDELTIRSVFLEALKTIPNVKGVSNHMGSKFTENEAAMQIFLETVQLQDLYYVDSLVTNQSKAFPIAQNYNMTAFKRDVFIDNEREEEYILSQLAQLKAIALQTGFAIGIGHDEKVTMKVLQQIIPEWKKEKIQFVRISDVIHSELIQPKKVS